MSNARRLRLRLRLRLAMISLLSALLLAGCTGAPVSGQLVDYRSDEPIAGATVMASQRGWGISDGQLVWDRTYTTSTRTGADGRFQLRLPAPGLLAWGGGTLTVEATGYQRLTEVPTAAGTSLRLQSVPALLTTVPGGIAQVGVLADGQAFGWSFVENRPTTDPARADIFPESIQQAPLRLTLTVPAGGGIRFVSQAEQGIAAVSYGHLLRYADEAPAEGYGTSLALDETSSGTIFIRTPYQRYAKLGFDPLRLSRGSGRLAGLPQPAQLVLMLPFAYNPWPGPALPFDPASSIRGVDRLYAAAAEVPADGIIRPIARRYRLTVLGSSGTTIDTLVMRLAPGVPQSVEGCPRPEQARFRYQNLLLSYGGDGLPRVQVSVQGERFSFHSADNLVSRRLPTVLTFHEYSDRAAPQAYELRLQELADEAVREGAECPYSAADRFLDQL